LFRTFDRETIRKFGIYLGYIWDKFWDNSRCRGFCVILYGAARAMRTRAADQPARRPIVVSLPPPLPAGKGR
jgi:hypothetical protein